MSQIDDVAVRAIRALMDKNQKARMEQVRLQLEGPLAFLRPDVQSKLNLDLPQIEAIGDLVTHGREAVQKAATVPGQVDMNALKTGAFSAELKDKMAQSRRSALKAGRATMQGIDKVLRPKQRAAYRAMLGDPYDVTNMGGLPMTNRDGEIDPSGVRKPTKPAAAGGSAGDAAGRRDK